MALAMVLGAGAQRWQDRSLSDDERVQALIQELTLDEKINLLGSDAIPRLGIADSRSNEAIHGVSLGGPAGNFRMPQPTSSFPQGYGMGQTWDRELMYLFGEQIATEARALFQNPRGAGAGLVLWAPNADLGRDPRWGRTEECFGEDPVLVGALAASMIQGMQGPDPRYWRAASLMKHFLANSNEDKRESTSSDFNDGLWREYYSYGFWKGFTEGGAESYMAAYNKYNGIPCTVHPMLKDVLAEEWNVKGIATTDGGAFKLLITGHDYYPDYATAAEACIKNGINRFLDRYDDAVREALQRGLITEADLDKVIAGRLYVKLKLGQLDNVYDTENPYLGIGIETPADPWNQPEAKALVRRATDESMVLLKNNGLLPLDTARVKKIVVFGNRADTVLQDWYGGQMPYLVSPLQAMRQIADRNGIELKYFRYNQGDEAVKAAHEADVVIACVGNHPVTATDYEERPPWGKGANLGEGREAVDRQSLQLDTEDLIRLMHKANPNTVVMLISSFPYAINWTQENVPAIVHCAQSSQELGNSVAAVLFGNYNPGGRLTQTWPRSITDLPDMMDYDLTNGHTYMYYKADPLYPFGHGLSYTTFAYGKPKLSVSDDVLQVEFELSNTGDREGDEVAQVYVKIPGDKANKRLKGFARQRLQAGERRKVTIDIPLSDLRLWDETSNSWQLPHGKYAIQLGSSSADIRQKSAITL